MYFLAERPRPRRQAAVPRPAAPVAQAAQRGKGGGGFSRAFGNNLDGFEAVRGLRGSWRRPTRRRSSRTRRCSRTCSWSSRRGTTFATVSDLKRAAVKEGYRMHYTRQPHTGRRSRTSRSTSRMRRKPFRDDELFFFQRADAPLPDLCRYEGSPAPHAVLHAGRGHQARGAGGACRSRARISAGRD